MYVDVVRALHSGLTGMWRQCGRVVRTPDLKIRWSRVQVPFWSLAGVILGSPEFNSSARLVNSQPICLLAVGIFNHVTCMFIYIVCFIVCFHWPWKTPLGEWSIKIPDIGFERWPGWLWCVLRQHSAPIMSLFTHGWVVGKPINSTRGLKVDLVV